MGMTSYDLSVLHYLKEKGHIPHHQSVMEIGAQQLANNFLAAEDLLVKTSELFKTTTPHNFPKVVPSELAHGSLVAQSSVAPSARDFWQWIGFKHAAIDIDESPGSIALDLNFDGIKRKHRGKFALVTNMGTTEHIANQHNAFKVIHELTAQHGVMYHNVPSQGMMNHGLINYNLKFFWMLARSNGYEWLFANYLNSAEYYGLPQNIIDQCSPYNAAIIDHANIYRVADASIVVALKKTFDIPFVSPLDVPTGTGTTNKLTRKRYWSVLTENAFENLIDKKALQQRSITRRVIRKLRSLMMPG